MKDFVELVRFLYTQFLLRDIAGKVLPGALVTFGASSALVGTQSVIAWTRELTSLEIVIGFSFLWLAGLAVQALGIACGALRYSRKYGSADEFHQELRKFRDAGLSDDDHKQLERFMSIREAYGNGAVAVLISLLFWLAIQPWNANFLQSIQWPQIMLTIATIALAVALWLGHRETLTNQDAFWSTAVNSRKDAVTAVAAPGFYFLACGSESPSSKDEQPPSANSDHNAKNSDS